MESIAWPLKDKELQSIQVGFNLLSCHGNADVSKYFRSIDDFFFTFCLSISMNKERLTNSVSVCIYQML